MRTCAGFCRENIENTDFMMPPLAAGLSVDAVAVGVDVVEDAGATAAGAAGGARGVVPSEAATVVVVGVAAAAATAAGVDVRRKSLADFDDVRCGVLLRRSPLAPPLPPPPPPSSDVNDRITLNHDDERDAAATRDVSK